jgi:hypothetical protein
MDWRIKAFIQKRLAVTRFGDKLNHSLITLNKNYHKNVVTYQSHEALRKFSLAHIDWSNHRTALEIGTGYSLISAITLALVGFDKVITADITPDIAFSTFKKQRKYLGGEAFVEQISTHSKHSRQELVNKINQVNEAATFEAVFEILNIRYLAPYRFEDIENETSQLDYITSQVVLEHVPPDILDTLFSKTKTWLSKDGYGIHTINFIDHFANPGLFRDKSISEFNFLRYSDKYWSSWAGNPIAYTNRLAYPYYIGLCEKYQLEVVDFHGENYRERVDLDLSLIHEDVISKYSGAINREQLTQFQRGTLVLRSGS